MSLASLNAAATAQLAHLLYRTCERLAHSQPGDGGGGRTNHWPEPGDGTPCDCFYEEAQAPGKGRLGYQADAGYDYDVWIKPDQAMAARDRIVVDGMTLSVIEVPPVGAPGPLRRAKTSKV